MRRSLLRVALHNCLPGGEGRGMFCLLPLTGFATSIYPRPLRESPPPHPLPALAAFSLPPRTDRAWLLFESAILLLAALLFWRLLLHRRIAARVVKRERKQAALVLKQEHARRLNAQHELRSLSQRLLAAHEVERGHLARELHDDVTQRLARLAIDAAQLEHNIPSGPEGSMARSMREELVRLSDDVHSLAYRLHPSILQDLGLVEALRAECDRFSLPGSARIDFKTRDVPRDISRDAASALFRVAQEALRNVARHAGAHTVGVSLAGFDGGLQLAVHDDGVGFDPATVRTHPSLGHACMKERISLVKGELDIESAPAHGTQVIAWVPLPQPSL